MELMTLHLERDVTSHEHETDHPAVPVPRLITVVLLLQAMFLTFAPFSAARAASVIDRVARDLSVPSETLKAGQFRILEEAGAVPIEEAARKSLVTPTLVQRVGASVTAVAAPSMDRSVLDPEVAYALPVQFRALSQKGTASPTPVDFEPIVVVVSGLRFVERSQRFAAELAVGLRNRADPSDRSVLLEPIDLLLRADADSIQPSDLRIQKLGIPLRVLIEVKDPLAPFEIFARTLLDHGDRIEVPIHRPRVLVEPARTTIEGWGLGKTLVQVQVEGLDDPGSLSVALSTTRGAISPTPIKLGPDGRATVELRSEGIGAAVIRASGAPLEAAQASVQFAAPWSFLIASLIGAVAGWFLKTRAHSKSISSFVVALCSSAVLLAAYTLGIRWMQWVPQAQVGEVLAFFVAAAGAFTGARFLLQRK